MQGIVNKIELGSNADTVEAAAEEIRTESRTLRERAIKKYTGRSGSSLTWARVQQQLREIDSAEQAAIDSVVRRFHPVPPPVEGLVRPLPPATPSLTDADAETASDGADDEIVVVSAAGEVAGTVPAGAVTDDASRQEGKAGDAVPADGPAGAIPVGDKAGVTNDQAAGAASSGKPAAGAKASKRKGATRPKPTASAASTAPLTSQTLKESATARGREVIAAFQPLIDRLKALSDKSVALEVRFPQPAPVAQGEKGQGRKGRGQKGQGQKPPAKQLLTRRILESRVDTAHNDILMDAKRMAAKCQSEILDWLRGYLDPKGERGNHDVFDAAAEKARQKARRAELGTLGPYVEGLGQELERITNRVLGQLAELNKSSRRANQAAVQVLPLAEGRDEDVVVEGEEAAKEESED